MQPTSSHRVQYDLRPAKQIERRMIIDALQRLTLAGFPVSEYQYTGFGSVYFVDFILFHKMLGIYRMLSVEHSDELEKRVLFNRPFNCIGVRMEAAAAVIPTLSRDLRHLLWLDYDGPISSEYIGDILSAMTHLSAGSIFLVTLDVEPPEVGGLGDDSVKAGPKQWRAYYIEQTGDLLDPKLTVAQFAKSKLPAITTKIVHAAIRDGLAGRQEVHYSPLFNFRYKDGHEMLTLGGIVVSQAEERMIERSTVGKTSEEVPYIRRTLTAEASRVPNLVVTRKERISLDSMMPHGKGRKRFHLANDIIEQYAEVYRFFPAYAELLL